MAARAAFSRFAPALARASAVPSLAARRAALVRGYATQGNDTTMVGTRQSRTMVLWLSLDFPLGFR